LRFQPVLQSGFLEAESVAELVVFGASAEEQPKLIEHARQQVDHFIQLKQGMFEKQAGRIVVRS
jgi:hypothetical protein